MTQDFPSTAPTPRLITHLEAIAHVRFLLGELETATDWRVGYTKATLVTFATQVEALLRETRP